MLVAVELILTNAMALFARLAPVGLLARLLAALAGLLFAQEKEEAGHGGKSASDDRRLAQHYLYAYRIVAAEREIRDNQFARADQILAECSPKLRGFEWHYLNRRCHEEVLTIPVPGGVTLGALAFSPDDKYVAIGTIDKKIRIHNSADGKEVRAIVGLENWTNRVAFSPDGQRLAATVGPAVKVWDVSTGKEVLKFTGHGEAAYTVALSRDGTRATSCGSDGRVRIWDAKTAKEHLAIKARFEIVYEARFSPDGSRVAAFTEMNPVAAIDAPPPHGGLAVWDATTGKELLFLENLAGSLDFSPDGKRMAATQGKDRQSVKVLDVVSGAELFALSGHSKLIWQVKFSPDGKRIATSSVDRTVRVWDAEEGEELFVLRGHSAAVANLAYSNDGRRLASGSGEEVRIWDANNPPGPVVIEAHGSHLDSLAFSADGKLLITSGSDLVDETTRKEIKVWDLASRKPARVIPLADNRGVMQVASSSDGTRVAATLYHSGPGRVGFVAVWDAATGRQLWEALAMEKKLPYGLTFSPDGKLIASAGQDQLVRLWNAETGKPVRTLTGHTGTVFYPAFSPDGKLLASPGHDGAARIWDVATGKALHTLQREEGSINWVAFRPDGKHLTSAGIVKSPPNAELTTWDVATGVEVMRLKGHEFAVAYVAYGPDGRRLFSSGDHIRVWDAATGLELLTIRRTDEMGAGALFSPDGRHFAVPYGRGVVQVWDVGPRP